MLFGGTSAGSIVAGLYAVGYAPQEILKLFQCFAKDVMRHKTKKYSRQHKRSRRY